MTTKYSYLRPGYVRSKDIDESAMTAAERHARLERKARMCTLKWDELTLQEKKDLYVNVEYMVRRQFPDLLRDLRRDYSRHTKAEILRSAVETIIDLHDDGLVTFSIGGGKFNIIATCHLERRRC
jgi:hypothetical protein